MKQNQDENFGEFITRVKSQAKKCDFGEQNDLLVRDKIVNGINDVLTVERLLREESEKLTLEMAIKICQTAESAKEQIKVVKAGNRRDSQETVEIDAVKQHNYGNSKKTMEGYGHNISCRNCGRQHKVKQCPAYGKLCNNCSKPNHFAKVCRSNKMYKAEAVNVDESKQFDIGELTSESSTMKGTIWTERLRIGNGREFLSFKLDTGAQANILSMYYYNRINKKGKMQPTNDVLVAYGGEKIRPIGTTDLSLKGKTCRFYVINGNNEPLLGCDDCLKLELIKRLPVNLVSNLNTAEEIVEKYREQFQGLGLMPGEVNIEIDTAIQPVISQQRNNIPFSLKDKLKDELERLEGLRVIEKVTHPTDWVSNLVIREKQNGDLRICLQPTNLNKAIKRPHHKAKTARQVADELAGKSLFSVIDCTKGYYMVKLNEASSDLCCFNTPFHRYRFLRMPFGIRCASDIFQLKNEQIFGHIKGVHIIQDDLLISASNEKEHDQILTEVLERAKQCGVKFNKNKLQLKRNQVTYMGLRFGANGLNPDPEKVRAIRDMPTPTDQKGVLRFLGMLNFLREFIPNMAEKTAQLRQLLKKNTEWTWSQDHKKEFENLTNILAEDALLRYFNPTKEIMLQVDSSKDGMGVCLMQDKQPVAYKSRALTETEKRYSQIEKELLSVVYACETMNTYIYGVKTVIQTDHKPLQSIINKPLHKVSPRLQRLLHRLYKYDIILVYTPGKEMYVADTLSRAFLNDGKMQTPSKQEIQMDMAIHSILKEVPASDRRMQEIRQETEQDYLCKELKKWIQEGFPENKSRVSQEIKPFWDIKHELSFEEGLILRGARIYIPEKLQTSVLQCLHQSHMGIEKTKARANEIIFWPGMTKNIETIISKCDTCNMFRKKQQKESMMSHEVPKQAWEKISFYIFCFGGQDFLLVVDYFSKFPIVCPLRGKTAQHIIEQLREIFSNYGIPRCA